MREIKFRVCDNVDYMSIPFTHKDLQEKKIQFTDECKVMQFTGMQDKNGVEIYEGDIVRMPRGMKYYVLFENGSFVCYHAKLKDAVNGGNMKWGLLSRAYELGEYFNLEIIGNIYQDKHLLEL